VPLTKDGEIQLPVAIKPRLLRLDLTAQLKLRPFKTSDKIEFFSDTQSVPLNLAEG
jgi:hypothetical protein